MFFTRDRDGKTFESTEYPFITEISHNEETHILSFKIAVGSKSERIVFAGVYLNYIPKANLLPIDPTVNVLRVARQFVFNVNRTSNFKLDYVRHKIQSPALAGGFPTKFNYFYGKPFTARVRFECSLYEGGTGNIDILLQDYDEASIANTAEHAVRNLLEALHLALSYDYGLMYYIK
jgi:hypothetical protein